MSLKKEPNSNILDFQLKKHSSKLVTRSVALEEHHLDFIRKLNINLSAFVRHLIDKAIEDLKKKEK